MTAGQPTQKATTGLNERQMVLQRLERGEKNTSIGIIFFFPKHNVCRLVYTFKPVHWNFWLESTKKTEAMMEKKAVHVELQTLLQKNSNVFFNGYKQ